MKKRKRKNERREDLGNNIPNPTHSARCRREEKLIIIGDIRGIKELHEKECADRVLSGCQTTDRTIRIPDQNLRSKNMAVMQWEFGSRVPRVGFKD